MKALRTFARCAAITLLFGSSLHAGTFNAFGPQKYVRNTGTPVTVTNSFSILNPNTQYTLHVQNANVASAVIFINGKQILSPSDFNPNVTVIDRAITLQLNNTIAVQVRSASGTSLTATVIGVDSDLPIITASAAPAADTFGWNNTNVVVKFTCSDKTSGVAFCPPSVTVSTEAANQVITGTASDRAGNTASASVTLNIDKTAPTISAVAVPPPNAFGWNNAASVTVTFNCLDVLSGIASCTPPAILNAEGANQIAAGTAVDRAGNMASTNATVSIDRTPPTITAQASPAPNAAGWNNTAVNVAFACVDSLSGVASCPPAAMVNSEGANQNISGTALDKAGNSASAAVVLNIDETPPTVTATPVPAANPAGWNNNNVTINFNCSDTLSGVDSCPAQTIVTTEGASQVFAGTARDRAGNASTASATLNIDKTPPSLKITAPLSGATVIVPTVTLEGLVTDTLSGVSGVTCNGAAAQVSGSALTCGVPLSVGLNTISVVATDVAGNATTSTLTINFSATPTITITSPLNLSVVNATPVVVTGTVSDPNATVSVNGTAVSLASGSFSTPVVLKEGGNTITVVAQSGGGTPATATISVSLDTTPPHVTIDSPADGTITTSSTIAVSGMINDIVPGTVNAQQATVTVNGMPAQVLNRNYLLHAVPLSPGPNTITALGTDLAGNTASVSITVVQKTVISQPTINLVSGDGQTGTIGTPVASPLIVQLKDGTGNPVAGQAVVFKVTGSNGTLSGTAIAGTNGGPTLVVNSDANGMAQVAWTLGMRAGAGNNTVKATAANFAGEVNFGAITLPATPGLISVDSGNNQFGAVGQPLPHPFVLVVTDPGHNRLPNIAVTFTVQQGGGFFTGQGSQIPLPGQTNFTSIIVKTDSDGRAMAILTLGQQEGIQNNLVEANFAGNQGFPATFTASGRVAGDPAATSISGVALDNTNVPIAGITMQVDGTALTTQTDQQGQFLLTGVPVGKVKLIADGATAARPGTWPKLEYELVTVSGTNNTLGMPVYLLPLDLPHGLQVDETHGGTLTLPDVPGFALTIAPGSVTFPDGGKSGLVSVTVVHADKVPMTPNFGQQPRFIVSIQPAGAHFNPPAPMTIPNVDGLTPGEVTEMYSFDHDLGSFVAIGTGTVSKDGSVIKSDPGVGIVKGGWHCGGNPSPTGTTHNCGICETCIVDTCAPNPIGSNCGPCWDAGVCNISGTCVNGSPKPKGTSCGSCFNGGVCDGQGNCTGAGSSPNGASCSQNPCFVGQSCQNGACLGGSPTSPGTSCSLNSSNNCVAGACDGNGNCTAAPANQGASCNQNPCLTGQTCQSGTCQGGIPVPASPPTSCQFNSSNPCLIGVCDASGNCTATPASQGTACSAANNSCLRGTCDAGGNCITSPAIGATCSDACTSDGTCDQNGACLGGAQKSIGAINANVSLISGTAIEPNQPLLFTVNVIASNCNNITFTWDFGDGSSPSSFQNPIHSYSSIGVYTATVTASCDSCPQATAQTTVQVTVMTKEITVVAWVDGSQIDLNALGAAAGITIKLGLNTPIACSATLTSWLAGIRVGIFSDADRQYANGFLLKNSDNAEPPSSFASDIEDFFELAGDYRLFNRARMSLNKTSGQVSGTPIFDDRSITNVGSTPDPCGLVPTGTPILGGAPEVYFFNGARNISTLGTSVYQLNEGRLGTKGQIINRTLNKCVGLFCTGIPLETVTPWIWSVIKFDLDGNFMPLESVNSPSGLQDHQIFPTYYVYEDGILVRRYSQVAPEIFILLDASSQIFPGDIQ